MSTTTTEDFSVRGLRREDLHSVTAVHAASFAESALSLLGRRPIHRYYEWQMDGPHELAATGAFRSGELTGFCFAGTFDGALEGFLQHNKRLLCLCLMMRPWLLGKPVVRRRMKLGAGLLYRLRGQPAAAGPRTPPRRTYGILVIAVHPSYRRMGVGRRLMTLSEQTAAERGFDEITLTVDPANHSAIAFYQELNWEKVCQGTEWAGTMRKRV